MGCYYNYRLYVFEWVYKVYNVKKTYQFKLNVEDDKYDTGKTANIKVSGLEILPSGTKDHELERRRLKLRLYL